MPIYEYHCPDCHTSFEHLQLSSGEAASCPQCENQQVERKLSLFSSRGGLSADEGPSGGCGCTPSSCGCH
jgi:putative FmdB family regulatory protein